MATPRPAPKFWAEGIRDDGTCAIMWCIFNTKEEMLEAAPLLAEGFRDIHIKWILYQAKVGIMSGAKIIGRVW